MQYRDIIYVTWLLLIASVQFISVTQSCPTLCNPMNQGKLEVVKQEMARVSVDILGISKLKWPGMGKFNSDDHYIYYCEQESLRRNGIAIIVNKRV